MKRTLTYFLILTFVFCIRPFFMSRVFSLHTDMAMNKQYDTLYITGDMNIASRDSLVIPAGTMVIFTGHYSINVQGKIIADGTPTDSIIFTVVDTLGFSNIYIGAGGWNGIRFEDTPAENDSSLFSYCRFEYGKATGDSANCYGGAIRLVRYHDVHITNSTFVNNYAFMRGGAIHAFKSDLTVEYSLFVQNYAGNDQPEIYGYGGGLNFNGANPKINFCTFKNNSSTGIGGGVSFDFSNPEMMNCVFTGNFSALGGAIGFLRSAPNRTIANLLINHNTAMFFGGGIAIISASPQLNNLTITQNHAAMGGGYYCNEYAFPDLYNSILWNNTGGEPGNPLGSQVWIWDVYSAPGFYHCDVQYGLAAFGGSMFIGVYENNIDVNPMFANPGNQEFKLTQNSPCINAGTPDTTGLLLPAFDLSMNPRIIHGLIDMGAYEYDGPMTGVIHGDANCDELVNVLDVISIVNQVLGLNPQPFCFDNADVNVDGIINVLDAIATTNIILQNQHW